MRIIRAHTLQYCANTGSDVRLLRNPRLDVTLLRMSNFRPVRRHIIALAHFAAHVLKKKNWDPRRAGNFRQPCAQSRPDLQNVRALIRPELPFERIAHHWTVNRQFDLLCLCETQEIVQVVNQPETLCVMLGFRLDVVVRHRRDSTVFNR